VWSEWAEAEFTTTAAPKVPLTGLTVSDVSHNGALLRWDTFTGTGAALHITIKGEMDPTGLAQKGYTALYDAAKKEFSGYFSDMTANATDLTPILLPQTAYTWKLAVVLDQNNEDPAVDGPGFTTTEEDPIFTSRLGNYSAVGTPSWLQEPGKPNWSGVVGAISGSRYSVTNFFNFNTENEATWGNVYIDYVKDGNKLYLDNKNFIARTQDGSQQVFAEGVIFRDNQPAAFVADGGVEIIWDATARTFTFPTQINGEDVAYTFAIYVDGQHDGWMCDLYKNVVVTVAASGGAARLDAVRIDHCTMPLIKGARKSSSVTNSTKVAAVAAKNFYMPYSYGTMTFSKMVK
jgi:hypothetical protein